MARTKLQLMIRRMNRAKWKRGRLQVGRFRVDILPTGKWCACVDAKPKISARFRSVPGAQRAGKKALRELMRKELAEPK